MTSHTAPWRSGVWLCSPVRRPCRTSETFLGFASGLLNVMANASGSSRLYESGELTWIVCTREACLRARACAYFKAVSEPGEKSVARRIFFRDNAMTGSRAFMRAPHSLDCQCNKRVTIEDVMAVTPDLRDLQLAEPFGLESAQTDWQSKVCLAERCLRKNGSYFLKMGGASLASKDSASPASSGTLCIRRRQRFQRNSASSFPWGRIFSASSKYRMAFSKLAINECGVWPA